MAGGYPEVIVCFWVSTHVHRRRFVVN